MKKLLAYFSVIASLFIGLSINAPSYSFASQDLIGQINQIFSEHKRTWGDLGICQYQIELDNDKKLIASDTCTNARLTWKYEVYIDELDKASFTDAYNEVFMPCTKNESARDEFSRPKCVVKTTLGARNKQPSQISLSHLILYIRPDSRAARRLAKLLTELIATNK